MGDSPVIPAMVMAVLLALSALPVGAGTTELGNSLRVEWNPDSLTLGPGAEGSFALAIENAGGTSLHVAVIFTAVKTPGGCRATVSPDFFELAPHAVQTVHVTVRSNAAYMQEKGTSDCRLLFYWGTNLTLDPQGHVANGTADANDSLTLPIEDDFTGVHARVAAIIAIPVAFLCAVAYIARRRSKGPRAPTGPSAR